MERLGLYLHIPFCKSKCIYCDFCSLPACGAALIDDYCAVLGDELRSAGPRAAGYAVDSVYFGGGTPSYLGAARLSRLLEQVRAQFRLTDDAELTLEANPDSADRAFLRAVRAAGFNRVSFGVQSFDDAELRLIGRAHDARQAIEAVEAAQAAGFDNLSLDLIYGLPRQTAASWRRTLEQAAALPVQHLSCYGLRPEEGTPLYASPLLAELPDDDTQADFYLWAVDFLAARGFAQYEISNFARPGRESRHNRKYWRMEPYLGFGAAAHSDFGGRRYGAVRALDQYMAGVRAGVPALAESETPDAAERARERTMLSLRTREGLALRTEPERALARRLAARGLAATDGVRVRLTPEGYLLSNGIIEDFWALDEAGNQL